MSHTTLHRAARSLAAIDLSRRAAEAVGVICFLVLFAISSGAQAYFKICNHTGSSVDVAIAYGVKDAPGTSTGGHLGVTAEGWWEVAPNGGCAQVSNINAGAHWVYYRATSKTVRSNGRSMLCVTSKAFTLQQQFRREGDRCPPGQRLAGFKRVDTAKKNHILNLR